MRLIFMGTPEFAATALDALYQAGHEIIAAYSRPPAQSGRGLQVQKTPVQRFCDAKGIDLYMPQNFKSPEVITQFQTHQADLAIVAAYGLLLPQVILDAPRVGCWNIHASLLPRWRGAAPIQRAIMAGDNQTGITIMQMDAGLDTGAILYQETISILPQDTAASLHDKLAHLGGQAMCTALATPALTTPALTTPAHTPHAQDETGALYAPKIQKAEARIDWQRPAAELDRHIRGLSPFPGAWCMWGKERLKILNCRIAEKTYPPAPPGTVLDDALTIACGEGALRLLSVQRAGKSALDAQTFQRGAKHLTSTGLA